MSENRVPPRRGLGKGLGALIVNTSGASDRPSDTNVERAGNDGFHWLNVDAIQPNPHQPRVHFDEIEIRELADSIREHGVLQPLIVADADDRPGGYRLIAGERRWRAAQLAGLTSVPALLRDASPMQLMEWALVENIQRTDLNPLEEAAAYLQLLNEHGLTQQQIAERVGKSRPAIANSLRLLDAPKSVQEALTNAEISAGHARTLLALKETELIEKALAIVLEQALSVRQTEALIGKFQAGADTQTAAAPTPESEETDIYLRAIEDRFRAGLGTKVNLSRNADGSGRLTIHFFNDEDLQSIYESIVGAGSFTQS